MKSRALDISSTIFALSTGSLPAAIAVVRLSGPNAFAIAGKLVGEKRAAQILSRGMHLVDLHSPTGAFIDQALVLSFPAPHSFTGQDVVEFQCHGSVPVVEELEQALHGLGALPAQKGEFSYRAYMHGKLDAQRIETLADVYAARDNSDLKSIYLRLDAATASKSERLRSLAVKIQAISTLLSTLPTNIRMWFKRHMPPLKSCSVNAHGCSVGTQASDWSARCLGLCWPGARTPENHRFSTLFCAATARSCIRKREPHGT